MEIKSTGVFPFAFHPVNGRAYFLLGKESWRRSYVASNTWCDFGGGIPSGKRISVERCAKNEVFEETFCVVNLSGVDLKTPAPGSDPPSLSNSIISHSGQKVPYKMFIVCIPWIESAPQTFDQRRRVGLEYNARKLKDSKLAGMLRDQFPTSFKVGDNRFREKYLEKSQITWVDAENLLKTIHRQPRGWRRYPSSAISVSHFNLRSEFFDTLAQNLALIYQSTVGIRQITPPRHTLQWKTRSSSEEDMPDSAPKPSEF